jgi:hypothetical protein
MHAYVVYACKGERFGGVAVRIEYINIKTAQQFATGLDLRA